MRLAIVLVLAYLTTALYYLWRDLSERNPLRRTFYVIKYRETGDRLGLMLAGMGWWVGAIRRSPDSQRGRAEGI
jgi:hypothetical protein